MNLFLKVIGVVTMTPDPYVNDLNSGKFLFLKKVTLGNNAFFIIDRTRKEEKRNRRNNFIAATLSRQSLQLSS